MRDKLAARPRRGIKKQFFNETDERGGPNQRKIVYPISSPQIHFSSDRHVPIFAVICIKRFADDVVDGAICADGIIHAYLAPSDRPSAYPTGPCSLIGFLIKENSAPTSIFLRASQFTFTFSEKF